MKIFIALILTTLLNFKAHAENYFPIMTSVIKVNFGTDAELKGFISSLFDDDGAAVSVFDEVKKGKVKISLVNDYNFKDANSLDLDELNDDLGLTHGYKISITKNVAPNGGDKFYATISYESDLHTNSDQPEAFKNDYRDVLYENRDGYMQADVFYKEENLIKLIMGKIQSNDAYYWEAGIGYHEINAEDSDRGIFISSITQQAWHHRYLNKRTEGSYREYNYLSQEGMSDSGAVIEALFGRDFTLRQKGNHRTFVRPEIETRLTKVKDASYVGTGITLGHDFVPQQDALFNVPIRVMGGFVAKKYSSGSYRQTFVEVSAQRHGLSFSLKYIKPLTKSPRYLNPLPNDFEERDLNEANKEPLISISLEGKFK